ncbi:MAG: FAD-dependent oxidoreductase [Armatimonadetes bacterium]|nr:FAD-dependent oxidoreductase [Armatimonadota bacterium]
MIGGLVLSSFLVGTATPGLAAVSSFRFRNQQEVGQCVGHVASAYAEPALGPRGEKVMRLVFVGGPGAVAAPGVFLACRPVGSLPPDWTKAKRVRLKLFNPGPVLLSLEVEVRTDTGSYHRHVMVSSGHWRSAVLDPGRIAAAGADLSRVQGIALHPVARQAGQLTEILIERIDVDWEGPVPVMPPVKPPSVARGQAAALVPELRPLGKVRWAGREIPIVAEEDVVVAGGGLAGVAAAVAAARGGAKTLLIERAGALGGMATSGYVPPAMRPELEGGLEKEFLDRCAEVGGPEQAHHPEVMKAVLFQMLKDAGARVLLYTTAIAPLMHHGAVRGVVIYSKAGFQAVRCKVAIDCTGDADIAARAGAPFQLGRGRDKLTQAMTLMFLLGNVNTDQFPGKGRRGAVTRQYVLAARQAGDFNIPYAGAAYCEKVIGGQHGVVNVNCVNVPGVDPLNPADLSYAHIQAFDAAWKLVEFFRKYVPGCEECYLVSSASFIGVRESRRILGEYVLTARDVLGSAVFDDGIARGFYPIDIHSADSRGDASGARLRAPYEIPYRCLVPRRVDNLLVAGRPISADHIAHGSLRVMGSTMALGQAAGTAAALCVARHVTPRQLDGREVQAALHEAGALPDIWQRVPDNLALASHGTRAVADSCLANYPDSAPGAIDGLVAIGSSSRWVSGDEQESHWLELHFDRPVTCSKVTLYYWPPNGEGEDPRYVPVKVEIQARLEHRWQTVASGRPEGIVQTLEFEPRTTRRLRLWFPKGCRSDWIIRLREVVVEGTEQTVKDVPSGR